jgi:type II secretory pathway component PulK
MPLVDMIVDDINKKIITARVSIAQSVNQKLLNALRTREALTLDKQRIEQQQIRLQKRHLTARVNLQNLCAIDSFMEYG